MFEYSPNPTRKEYREMKKFDESITWMSYLKFKDWQRRNWNPKAEEASNILLEYAGNHMFKFEVCHKMG